MIVDDGFIRLTKEEYDSIRTAEELLGISPQRTEGLLIATLLLDTTESMIRKSCQDFHIKELPL